ncbi:hypothetical protein K2173_019212 [Erythroxylum novogranatense]|uniref:Transmembrane protein n=1 Tax=Erythroxylum novogranatense TaxID=1862640 RepID=A0AAV8SU89_9ROSI|nr:hypothetical protein K2173_019212 [Erythroxylum novogranatense]
MDADKVSVPLVLCLIPFMFIVSFSSSEVVLPTAASVQSTAETTRLYGMSIQLEGIIRGRKIRGDPSPTAPQCDASAPSCGHGHR